MCIFGKKKSPSLPPLPTLPPAVESDEQVASAAGGINKKQRRLLGTKETLLTGSRGVADKASVSKKQLLGG